MFKNFSKKLTLTRIGEVELGFHSFKDPTLLNFSCMWLYSTRIDFVTNQILPNFFRKLQFETKLGSEKFVSIWKNIVTNQMRVSCITIRSRETFGKNIRFWSIKKSFSTIFGFSYSSWQELIILLFYNYLNTCEILFCCTNDTY